MTTELLYDIYINMETVEPLSYSPRWRKPENSPSVFIGDVAFELGDYYSDNSGHMIYVWADYIATIGPEIEWKKSSPKSGIGTEAEARAAFQSWLNSIDFARAKAAVNYAEALGLLAHAQKCLGDAEAAVESAEDRVDSTRYAYLERLRTT